MMVVLSVQLMGLQKVVKSAYSAVERMEQWMVAMMDDWMD
jgi:hypothetical protein